MVYNLHINIKYICVPIQLLTDKVGDKVKHSTHLWSGVEFFPISRLPVVACYTNISVRNARGHAGLPIRLSMRKSYDKHPATLLVKQCVTIPCLVYTPLYLCIFSRAIKTEPVFLHMLIQGLAIQTASIQFVDSYSSLSSICTRSSSTSKANSYMIAELLAGCSLPASPASFEVHGSLLPCSSVPSSSSVYSGFSWALFRRSTGFSAVRLLLKL